MSMNQLFMKKENEEKQNIGIKAKYIKTMDFEFNGVIILNCNTENEVAEKIKEKEVIKINNFGTIEYINSSYIMFYELQ